MLAVMVVTDLGDGTLASLAGDGLLSLREAVEAINTASPVDGIGPSSGEFGTGDTILFSAGLFGGAPQTLTLTAGEMELTSGVMISGPAGNLLTIDAQQNSRIFDIAFGSDDFTISQMTLTGGRAEGALEVGGAIRSATTGQLSVRRAVVTGNSTDGTFAHGGGIAAISGVLVVDSSITQNRVEESGSNGGGVFTTGDLDVRSSTVADNQTEGLFAAGGGLYADGTVTLDSSTVSGNRTIGAASPAGGILGVSGVELTESTVSGNQTLGDTSSGAGISSEGNVTVTRSTIVENEALGSNVTGGGIQVAASAPVTTQIVVSGVDCREQFGRRKQQRHRSRQRCFVGGSQLDRRCHGARHSRRDEFAQPRSTLGQSRRHRRSHANAHAPHGESGDRRGRCFDCCAASE